MVPLRLLRPLTTTGLMLALVSCQTNISQGMRVYPLSRTQPHDGLAVVNQPDGYGVHIWLDTDTRQAGVCHPYFDWTAESPDDWNMQPQDCPETRYMRKALKEGRRPAWFDFKRVLVEPS